jgi:hypothetical protein
VRKGSALYYGHITTLDEQGRALIQSANCFISVSMTITSAEWSEIIERIEAEEKEGDARAGKRRRENTVDMCRTAQLAAKRR